jgi:hypothetical protein
MCGGAVAEPRKISKADANREEVLRRYKRVLRDLLWVMGDENAIHSQVAIARLVASNSAPWRNYAGVGLDEIKLAKLLEQLECVQSASN